MAQLSAYLAGLPDRGTVGTLVHELVAEGLLSIEPRKGRRVLVAAGVFAGLWARAPPQLRAAMARNPAEVLGDAELAQRSAAEVADAVRGALREAIWERAEVRPGLLARLPLWLRGGRGELRGLFAGAREVSREIDELAASTRTPRRLLGVVDRLAAVNAAREAAVQRAVAAARQGSVRRRLRVGAAAWLGQRRADVATWWLVRRLPAELRGHSPQDAQTVLEERLQNIEQKLEARQNDERAAALEATNAAAIAGYRRRAVESVRDWALLGWARFMAPLAGFMGAFPGQAAGAPQIASTEFAAHYDRPAQWVTTQSAGGTTAASAAGLGAALLGDRLIKNMVPVVAFGVAGSAALLVLGLVPAAAVFLPSMFVVGSMGVAGGLVRGRMDRYHPVARELKDARDGRYETAFKAAQFVLPVAIGQGIAVAGVPVTMLALSAMAAALTGAVWWVLRGEGRDAMPRAPPAVWSSITGALRQIVGTPHGLVRALLSIPLLTALTGLYATALGGAMVDQLVLLNDPTQAMGTTAAVVSVLVTARGLATMFTGPVWPKLKALLGRPGAVAKALGRDVPVGAMDEARVLRGVTLLPVVLVVPAVWLVLSPGLWPFGLLLTTGAVVSAWARMPLNRWVEGATGASLNNTAKAATIALGAAISAAMLGDYSTLVANRVAAGSPYADVVAAGNLRLALLVIPVVVIVVIPAVVAHLSGKLRVGTLDDLRAALEDVIPPAVADAATANGITAALAARGINDVGSARALFLHPDWSPRRSRGLRSRARETRLASVELTDAERALLVTALESFDPPPPQARRPKNWLALAFTGPVNRLLARPWVRWTARVLVVAVTVVGVVVLLALPAGGSAVGRG
jgi:hypothetical protein